tara:strand:- start:286 stop:609 length:324 start_codon:yes stop_codon:yes gene_type:complete
MAKHRSEIVLLVLIVSTILNKFIIDESHHWFIAMLAISVNLFIYALSDYLSTKKKVPLVLSVLFTTEIIAVLFGWSLNTNYYTEFILLILLAGAYYIIKKYDSNIDT